MTQSLRVHACQPHTAIGVTWLVKLHGLTQPPVLGTLIHEGGKLERWEDSSEPVLNIQ